MNALLSTLQIPKKAPMKDDLYVVWIETNGGVLTWTDWEQNSDPQKYNTALIESYQAMGAGYPTKVLREGITPRPDGLFTNPRTQ